MWRTIRRGLTVALLRVAGLVRRRVPAGVLVVELGGELGRDTRWSAALVKGRNDPAAEEASDEAGQFDANVFLRIARRAERNRFGAFAYIGRGPVLEYRLHVSSMSRRFTAARAGTPTIEELEPAIDAVFALPGVRRRFTPRRLARLRRHSEASAYAWKAQELLRAGRLAESRRYLLRALRRHPTQTVDLLTLLLTTLGFVRHRAVRWVGRIDEPRVLEDTGPMQALEERPR